MCSRAPRRTIMPPDENSRRTDGIPKRLNVWLNHGRDVKYHMRYIEKIIKTIYGI